MWLWFLQVIDTLNIDFLRFVEIFDQLKFFLIIFRYQIVRDTWDYLIF